MALANLDSNSMSTVCVPREGVWFWECLIVQFSSYFKSWYRDPPRYTFKIWMPRQIQKIGICFSSAAFSKAKSN